MGRHKGEWKRPPLLLIIYSYKMFYDFPYLVTILDSSVHHFPTQWHGKEEKNGKTKRQFILLETWRTILCTIVNGTINVVGGNGECPRMSMELKGVAGDIKRRGDITKGGGHNEGGQNEGRDITKGGT